MSNIAVIALAGAQHIVKAGDKLEVMKLNAEVNKTFAPEILLSTDGDKVLFNDGKVEVKVLDTVKSEKLHIIKFKAKSRYRRRTGHRQDMTLIQVLSINGEKPESKSASAKSEPLANEMVVSDEVKPAKKAVTKKPASTKPKASTATKSKAKKA